MPMALRETVREFEVCLLHCPRLPRRVNGGDTLTRSVTTYCIKAVKRRCSNDLGGTDNRSRLSVCRRHKRLVANGDVSTTSCRCATRTRRFASVRATQFVRTYVV